MMGEKYYQNNLIEVVQVLEQTVRKRFGHRSNKDFINKYSIALKEANETLYWIKIMIKSELVSRGRFEQMITENERIIKILISSINKLKEKEPT
jgi:four helix bundle protein